MIHFYLDLILHSLDSSDISDHSIQSLSEEGRCESFVPCKRSVGRLKYPEIPNKLIRAFILESPGHGNFTT
jgi:hypothetical protein